MKRKFSILLAVLLVLPLALPLLEADGASVPPDDAPRQTLSIVLNDETGDPGLSAALMEAIRVELRAKGWSNNKINRVLGSVNIDGAGEVLNLKDLSDWVVADHYDAAYYYNTIPTLANNANAATVNTFRNNYFYKPNTTDKVNWYDVFGEFDKNGVANGSKESLRPYYATGYPTGVSAALNVTQKMEDWLKDPPIGHSTNVPILRSFDRHIMTGDASKSADGAKIDFVGYYNSKYIDYVYYPTEKSTTKHVWFDVDFGLINAHTLYGAGFMVNTGVIKTAAEAAAAGTGYNIGDLTGYVLLYVYPAVSSNTTTTPGSVDPTALNLYKIKGGVTPEYFHDYAKASDANTTTTSGPTLTDLFVGGALQNIGITSGTNWWEKMSVEIEVTPTNIQVWTAPEGETARDKDDPTTNRRINYTLAATGQQGFGPICSYRSHYCERATQVTFDNIVMEIEGEEANIMQILEASTFNDKAEMYFIDLQSVAKPDRTNSAPQTDVFEDAAEFMKKKGSHFNYLTNQDNKFLDDGGLGAGELGQQGQTFRFNATAGGYQVTIMEDKIDPETGKVVRDPITGKAVKEPKTYTCGTLGEAIGKYIASRLGDCVDGIVYVIDEVNVPGIDATGAEVGENCVIELTQEEIYLPPGYEVKSYGLTKKGVVKWKAYTPKTGKAGLFDQNDNTAFAKALAKGMILSISDQAIVKADKAPPAESVITFAEIKKADLKAKLYDGASDPFGKLAVNYAIYADNEDYTNGEWTLTFKNSLKTVFTKQDEETDEVFKGLMAEVDNIKESVLIAPMDPDFKNKKILPGFSYGELCMFDGIPVKPMGEKNGKPKAIKSVYMVKTAPKDNKDGTYTAAGKPKKFSASSIQKAPKYKVNYKLENLKMKANDVFVVKKGEGFDDVVGLKTHKDDKGRLVIDDSGYRQVPPKALVPKPSPINLSDTAKEVDALYADSDGFIPTIGVISNGYFLEIRKAATGKKPASMVQELRMATRASIEPKEFTVDAAKGKITDTTVKEYEVYDEGKGKWGGVKVTPSKEEYMIRVKPTAKVSKTGLTGTAASVTAKLVVTFEGGKLATAKIELLP